MLGTGGSFGYNTRVQSILLGTSRQDLEAAGHMHGQELMFTLLSLLLQSGTAPREVMPSTQGDLPTS